MPDALPDSVTDSPVDAARFMQDPERRQRQPGDLGERDLLTNFLEFQRDTLWWKVSGLTEQELQAPRTPSGMCLLGLVKHLAYVERVWFQVRFAGLDAYIPWMSGDSDGDFRVDPEDTPESVFAFYHAEIAESRRILANADSLDAMAAKANRPVSLRWIVIHMIEECARHVGHADLMREATDGQTGE